MPDSQKIESLVRKAQSGDYDAFNELYNRTAPELKVVGFSYLHKPEDVDDVLQETYIIIYRSFIGDKITPVKEPEKFLPWAKVIMKNQCLNFLAARKRKKEEFRSLNSEDDQVGMDQFDNSDDDRDFSPEDVAEADEARKFIEQKMQENVSTERQTCFALRQEGLTYREIAEKLSLPEGTVKSHVRYAKQYLQKCVREYEEKNDVKIHGIVPLPAAGMVHYLVQTGTKDSSHWISAEEQSKQTPHSGTAKSGLGKKIVFMSLIAAVIVGVIVFSLLRKPTPLNVPSTTRARPSYTIAPTRGEQRPVRTQTVPQAVSRNVTVRQAVASNDRKAVTRPMSREDPNYALLNHWRLEKGAWYWSEDHKTRVIVNTNSRNQLQPLKRDATLERIANLRAKGEIQFSRDETPYPSNYDVTEEAIMNSVLPSDNNNPFTLEKALNLSYDPVYNMDDESSGNSNESSDSRKNLLNPKCNVVGIGSYNYQDGSICWVIAYGYKK